MNLTLKLLRTIGSPFAPEKGRVLPENKSEALELYKYATKNKIGLLYSETLRKQDKLSEFGLDSEHTKESEKHIEQLMTAIRVSKLFDYSKINYAIFKSIMPFTAVPNDVDIIHFGSNDEYKRAVEIMLRSDYAEVKGHADSSQLGFHDARVCEHSGPKDVYDIDLYQEISASYVLYLDKRKLEKQVAEMDVMGEKIKVLRPEAELVAIIIHSIIPEQLCTLFVYYATLHHLIKKEFNIDEFIALSKENNVTFSVIAHCSLVAELHNKAHGFIPERIEEVLAKLGNEKRERNCLAKNDLKMPHRYSLFAVGLTLLEMMKGKKFRRSVGKQLMSMLNPKLFKWVIYNIIWRRRRETY